MRQAEVLSNKIVAGLLTESDEGLFIFQYNEDYLLNSNAAPISCAFPKRKDAFVADSLFPFFYNLLSEGANRETQSRSHRIEPNDDFGLLLATAKYDTIGAITINAISTNEI